MMISSLEILALRMQVHIQGQDPSVSGYGFQTRWIGGAKGLSLNK